MNITQLVRILWARRHLVFAVMASAVGLALIAKLLLPPTYLASTSLVIDNKGIDPVTGSALPAQGANVLTTQMDVITSRAVALKVVDALKLVEGTGPEADAKRNGRAFELLGALSVKPTSQSNVVRIKFEDDDPKFAADAANAFADAYVRTSLELRLDPARRQNVWFDDQLGTMRNTVEERRQKLSQYQRDHGIIATDERLDVENSRLNDLSRQLVEAQRVQQDAQARQRQAQSGNTSELPEVMSNGLVQSLKAELVRAEAKLAELSERYDRNHPQYQMANAEVRALRDKIASETNSATASISQSVQIANRQVANLQQAFDEQKARILELKRQRDEVSVLSREVETAQGAYDAMLQRASQVRLESQLDQTSVAILDRAAVPTAPAPPGLVLSVVLAAVFGTMLGTAIAVLLEMLDRRVRDGDELTRLAGLEVLAEVPRLRASFRPPRARLSYGQKPPALEAKPV
jgi:chain length determinant protein EpsF